MLDALHRGRGEWSLDDSSDPRVDVVVPTFRRPVALARCLEALENQKRLPDRVVVTVRVDDAASLAVVESAQAGLDRLEPVIVAEPGVIAAMSAGVAASTGSVIAFTDDDARPRPDWLARLLAHLDDPTVGGTGGRDLIPGQEGPLEHDVGCYTRWGKLTGNHHVGGGPARDVDVLKGVNMAFRVEALALPAPGVLRGSGAQVDFEVLMCGWARQQGWRLVYDPAIVVDHEGASREGPDRRVRPRSSAVFDAAYNSVVGSTLLDRRTLRRRAGFGVAVGTRDRPGMVRAAVGVVKREPEVLRRALPSLAGGLWATVSVLRGCGSDRPVVPADDLRNRSAACPRVILVAHDVHDHGGMERAFAELIRHLHPQVDFVVISSTLDASLRAAVAWRRVRIPQRPFCLKFAVFFVRGGLALRVIRRPGDVVQTLGAIVPNRVDLAAVHFCHAGLREVSGRLVANNSPPLRRANTVISRWLALRAERWCYRPSRLRCFLSVSRGVGNEAARHYPGIPVVTIPNGVDAERFAPNAVQRQRTRRDEHVGDALVCLFIGGDWDRKGLGIAIEAVALARATGANVVLWVVGPGDTSRFTALAHRHGVRDCVRFFGSQGETAHFYCAADIFLFPSGYEAFSLAMIEAAASGLPILAPAINGASELVGHDEGGLVLERSAAAFAGAVLDLANDRARRALMGKAARKRAETYTWEQAASSALDVYAQLLPRPPGIAQ